MHFKLVHILKNLGVNFPAGAVKLRAKGIAITLRELTVGEREKYKSSGLIYCEARTKREVSESVTEIYERLLIKQMPKGFKKPKPKSKIHPDEFPYVDKHGNIAPKHNPSIVLFPKDFRDFYFGLQHELSESIKRTAKIVRWRLAKRIPHLPTDHTRGLSWSINGRKWKKMPFDLSFKMNFDLVPRLEKEVLDDIRKLYGNDNEPLGHEIFLEAWELRSTNPRSSLVIGIAAAEVGFKQFVSKLVPHAQWLADNSPSPPLVKMVTNYLPLLPAKLKIVNEVLTLPKSVRTVVQKGVELRNRTTHVGQAAPSEKELEEILLAIRDLLYLLDFYCGYKWAITNIRPDTLNELAKENDLVVRGSSNIYEHRFPLDRFR
jgi:hypothetical protein